MKPVFLLLVLLTSVVAGAEDRPLAGQKKTAEKGGVTVSVIPFNRAESGTTSIDFQLSLDTHAGDLPSDMLAFAKLIMEGGAEIAPVKWSGEKGGHHLSGKLSFPASATGENESLTLVLNRVDGRNDMRFEWKVPSKAASNFTGGARGHTEKSHPLSRLIKQKQGLSEEAMREIPSHFRSWPSFSLERAGMTMSAL